MDAVVVGVGTVIADDPQLTVRDVAGSNPARVVIDPNFRLPVEARLLHDGAAPVYVVQAAAADRPNGGTPVVVPLAEGQLDPLAIVQALAGLGFRRLLIEGGARTVSAFLAAGAVDRFHLSIAPTLIGSGPVGVNLPPIDELDCALRPTTKVYRLGEDVLFDCAFDRTSQAV